MACSLPLYTSRLEILQKLLFTVWLVPLKPNVTTYSLNSSSVLVIAEYGLSITAVGMRNVEYIGTTAVLHPVQLIVSDIAIIIGLTTYHRRALHTVHTVFHSLNS